MMQCIVGNAVFLDSAAAAATIFFIKSLSSEPPAFIREALKIAWSIMRLLIHFFFLLISSWQREALVRLSWNVARCVGYQITARFKFMRCARNMCWTHVEFHRKWAHPHTCTHTLTVLQETRHPVWVSPHVICISCDISHRCQTALISHSCLLSLHCRNLFSQLQISYFLHLKFKYKE